MRNRLFIVVAPLMLAGIPVTEAVAWPAQPALAAGATLEFVHHKPWHQGGPPWLRRNRPGLGHHYGWERRRGWEDLDRRRWRNEYRFEEWIERPRRSYRFYFD